MSDWADEIASKIEPYPFVGTEPDLHRKAIAQALRKAKADGMRAICEYIKQNVEDNLKDDAVDFIAAVEAMAIKTEAGE